MADNPNPTPATPTGTAESPLTVTIANPSGPGTVVFPTPGIDETVEGGAYRFVGLDGSVTWKNAFGEEIKAPKGK